MLFADFCFVRRINHDNVDPPFCVCVTANSTHCSTKLFDESNLHLCFVFF